MAKMQESMTVVIKNQEAVDSFRASIVLLGEIFEDQPWNTRLVEVVDLLSVAMHGMEIDE